MSQQIKCLLTSQSGPEPCGEVSVVVQTCDSGTPRGVVRETGACSVEEVRVSTSARPELVKAVLSLWHTCTHTHTQSKSNCL